MTWHEKPWRRVLVAVLLARGLGGCTTGEPSWSEPTVTRDEETRALEPAEQEESLSARWNTEHPLSCADIRPEQLGPSRSFVTQALSREAACGPGTSEGSGSLALRNDGPLGVVAWTLVSSKGVPFGRTLLGGDFGSELLAQRRGVHLLIDSFPAAARLQAYSSEGEFLRQTSFLPAPIRASDVAADPDGGTVAAWWSAAGGEAEAWNLWVQSFDEKGRPRASPRLVRTLHTSESLVLLVGVDQRGRTLVLWRTSGTGVWEGQWLKRDGTAYKQSFSAAEDPDPSNLFSGRLRPLVGEGLVLRLGDQWVRQFPSGEPTALPAPGWLADSPGSDLTLIRHDRAYALVLPPTPVAGSGCQERVALFTRDGEPCGDLVFPFGGSDCSGRSLGIGREGTVIQQLELNIPANDQCAWRWWPRLLR
ncbi:hypothetical protein F0U62_03505 [Cystobacter fuscus]|uniref:hypothetical protein n=1 Tax=Cystobacter fuscus TaxID=43 RepID=UPI002B31429A|nr:hypothetical protein F0U62_03505 [Cystobacter fuscus]